MTAVEFLELRQGMGWSQYYLADAIGVTRSSITHWECDRAPVPSPVAKAMRRAHKKVRSARELLWATS